MFAQSSAAWATLTSLLYLSLTVYAQSLAPCPSNDRQTYTLSDGHTFRIFCSDDSSPSQFLTQYNIASFQACMLLCDQTSGCNAVTYSGTTCYLKSSLASLISSTASIASASRFDFTYPAPVANYANASVGCGTPLPSTQVQGGASTTAYILTTDGVNRTYNIHIPWSYDPTKAAPLIMTFHGQGSSPTAHETESAWSTETFNPYSIVVYPAAAHSVSAL